LHEFDVQSLTGSQERKVICGVASQIMEQLQIETYILENRILHLYDEKLSGDSGLITSKRCRPNFGEIYDQNRRDTDKQGKR
jgi:hypothetical protein